MLNLDQRLKLITELFPDQQQLGFTGIDSLKAWVVSELGSLEVLERPVRSETGWRRAKPVSQVYHICAGNLSISAEMSLLISILLGCEAYFKLPSRGLPGFEQRVQQLPSVWKERVHLLSNHEAALMQDCGAVVVFGSDHTVEQVRHECFAGQRLLIYGHKISLGILTPGSVSAKWAEAAVQETIAYQQCGCLSPQSYLCPDPIDVAPFSECLAEAFEKSSATSELYSLEAQALIFDARQRAAVSGEKTFHSQEGFPWTVVQRSQSRIQPGPGFGFIEVVPVSEWGPVLDSWKGKISSVSFSCEQITQEQWTFWENYGVHRLCQMGNLQLPPVAWPHDGRPRLADLVNWSYADPNLEVE